MNLLVVQHEDQCPSAWFGQWLAAAGCALDVRRPYAGDELPLDLTGHAGMLVLGGSMGAYDDADYAWLSEVKRLVRDAAVDGVPSLGICLGHQLSAVALGGEVIRNALGQQLGLSDVGWRPEADDDALVGGLELPKRGVHWNNDVVHRLPDDAVVLAYAPRDEVQVARFAPTVWGVQLHPEANEHVVAPWADSDRPLYPDGVVDRAVASIAEASDELAASWRPLAERFAGIVQRAGR
jgi:GMP synthase (glutamine-hydrolysing)